MKSAVVCLIFALVGCACLARCDRGLNWRYPDEGASVKSDFYASSDANTRGSGETEADSAAYTGGYGSSKGGSVELYGRAKAISTAKAESQCKVALRKVFQHAKYPYNNVYIKKQCLAYGGVFASTFASAVADTFVYAKSDGDSKGCVNAKATGEAAAKAFGAIVVKAFVYVKSYYGYRLNVLSEYQYAALFSEAAAHSFTYVCVEGDAKAEAYKNVITKASNTATVKAFIAACLGSYGGVSGGKVDVEQKEFGSTSGHVKTEAEDDGKSYGGAKGHGDANSAVKTLCKSVEEYKHCCGGYYYPAPRHCPYGKCPEKKKCTFKKKEHNKKIYEIEGNLCVCDYY